MSRKDMVYVADRFHGIHHYSKMDEQQASLFDVMVVVVADMFEAGNKQFDRDKFYAAIYKCEDK